MWKYNYTLKKPTKILNLPLVCLNSQVGKEVTAFNHFLSRDHKSVSALVDFSFRCTSAPALCNTRLLLCKMGCTAGNGGLDSNASWRRLEWFPLSYFPCPCACFLPLSCLTAEIRFTDSFVALFTAVTVPGPSPALCQIRPFNSHCLWLLLTPGFLTLYIHNLVERRKWSSSSFWRAKYAVCI